MSNSFCFPWEISFLQWIQSAESPFLTMLAKFATLFGEEYFLILVVGLCFWCIDKRLGRNVSLAVSGSILFGCLIQGVVLRLRPYMDHSEVRCIRPAYPEEDPMSVVAQGYSFPSLHSTLAAGGYGTLAMNVKKKFFNRIVPVLVLLVGISRLYFGVHYPTDVLCGWILGAAVMLLFFRIERKNGYKIGFILQLVVGVFGFFYCRDNGFFTIYGVLIGLFLGFLYEEKYVKFEMGKKWWSFVLRPVLGLLVFAAVSVILKLPVQKLPADGYAALQLGYRTFRYTLSTFVTMGLYPRLFNRFRFL